MGGSSVASLVVCLLLRGVLSSHANQWSCVEIPIPWVDQRNVLCPVNTYLNGFYRADTRRGNASCGTTDGNAECLSSLQAMRCCSMDMAQNVATRSTASDVSTDFDDYGANFACPQTYFMAGVYFRTDEKLDGFDTLKCYRPDGPETTVTSYSTPVTQAGIPSGYSNPPLAGMWLTCNVYQYVVGLYSLPYQSGNHQAQDIFDMSLLCATPMDATCGGPPQRNNMTVAYNATCTHQRCTALQTCKTGYEASNGISPSTLTCLNGAVGQLFDWRGTQLSCLDVNECNTTCSPTQALDPIGNRCNNCHQTRGICTNTYGELGGFTCRCQPGFTGDGRAGNCTDIQECLRPCNTLAGETPSSFACHNCSLNANCTEKVPGFTCACKPGYGPFPSCPDINECGTNCSGPLATDCNRCDAHASCRNTDGGYSCTCAPGWNGTGLACVDIDECTFEPCNGTNIPCYQCPSGTKCQNNNNGSFYSCVCADGFTSNGQGGCVNVNECLNASFYCPNSACVDTSPGFLCGPRFSFIMIDGTLLSASPLTLLSSNQSLPAQTVTFRIQNVSGSFAWQGGLYYGDTQNPTRYQATGCSPATVTAGNYTCSMAPGTGRNLFFTILFTSTVPGSPTGVFSDTSKLFSYPRPSLTPGSLRATQGGAGSTSLGIGLVFGLTTVVWMDGLNLPPSKLDLSMSYGGGQFPCIVQTSDPLIVSCAVRPQIGSGMTFNLIAGHGSQSWAVNGTDTLNLTVAGPSIVSLLGCTPASSTVIFDCPTDGKVPLQITLDQDITSSSVLMLIGGSSCLDTRISPSNNRTFNCTLPPGAGSDLLVTVGMGVAFSPAQPLLSYIRPTVTSLTSDACPNNGSLHVIDCPTLPPVGSQLTLSGLDFGPASSIFVAGIRYPNPKPCSSVAPVQCVYIPLPNYTSAMAAHEQPVSILQENGQLSNLSMSIKYKYLCDAGLFESGGVCLPCPAGTFSNAINALCNSTCMPCSPGSYQSLQGATTCQLCRPGFAQDQAGTIACDQCQPGSFSNIFGEVQCLACGAGTYTNLPNQTACVACARGFFQPNINQSACLPCGGGFYADTTAQAVCKACPPGYFNALNMSFSCSPCLPGTYSKAYNASTCKNCLAGSFSNAQAWSVDCQLCAPGRYLNTSSLNTACFPCQPGRQQQNIGSANCTACDLGHYSPGSGSSCLECIVGTYSLGGAASCLTCSPGFFQPDTAASNCTACPPGSWNRDPGSSSCFACEIGDFSNTPNATKCTPCPPGTASKMEAATSCTTCGIGSYQPSSGQAICLDCPPGTIGDGLGEEACLDCDVGTFSALPKSSACLNCSAGFYQNGLGQSSCSPCDEGQYQDMEQQTGCQNCPAGKRSVVPLGSLACVECVYGKYTNVGGATACINCPLGKFSNTTNQTTCTDCALGYFLANETLQTCIPCPIGSYTPAAGASVCRGCAPGKFSLGGGSSAISLTCDDCPAGTHASLVGSTGCLNCSVGNFSAGSGHPDCLACPVGQVTDFEGSTGCERCPLNAFPNAARSTCLCSTGYYAVVALDNTMHCEKCTIEMVCKVPGLSDYEVATASGWWRPNSGFNYLRCPNEQFCLGGVGNNNLCLPHHYGPLCGLCEAGYQSAGGGACKACDSRESNFAQATLVLLAMVVLAAIGFYLVLRMSNLQSKNISTLIAKEEQATKDSIKAQLEQYNTQDVGAAANDYLDDTEDSAESSSEAYDAAFAAQKDVLARSSNLLTSQSMAAFGAIFKTRRTPNFVFKVKIMVGFFQIASILPNQGGIQWPKHFVDFITIFSFFNFDFMPWQSLGCVATINYFHKVLIVGCTPFVVLGLLLLFFYIPMLLKDQASIEDQIERQQKHARTTRQLVKLLLFTVFLLYPFVSKTVMGVFNCVEINDSWYLLADLSLICFNDQWTQYAYVAGFFALIYPIGIPLVYYVLLRINRADLKSPTTLFMLGFLYEAYTPKCFYWELLDMCHKLTLTSLVIFLPSMYELVVSMAILIVYLELLLWLQPYLRKGDDRFHQLVQIELYLFCLMGFMLTPPDAISLDEATEILVSVLLIALVVFLMSSFLIIAGRNVRKLIKQYRQAKAPAAASFAPAETPMGPQSVSLSSATSRTLQSMPPSP